MSETGSRPVEPTSIFVGRLHADTRQEDLSRLFEKHGKIKRCDLKRGGYAFVEFFDSNDARNALVEDGAHLLGESIRVMMAKVCFFFFFFMLYFMPAAPACLSVSAPRRCIHCCPLSVVVPSTSTMGQQQYACTHGYIHAHTKRRGNEEKKCLAQGTSPAQPKLSTHLALFCRPSVCLPALLAHEGNTQEKPEAQPAWLVYLVFDARMADPGTNGCFRCGSSEHWSKNCPSREEDRGLGLPKWQMAGARGRSRSPPPRSRGGSYSSRRYSRSRSRSPAHRSSRSRRYSRSRSRSPGYRRSSRRDRSRSRSRSPPRRSRRDRSRSRSRSRDRHHRSSRRDRSSSRDRRGRSPSPRRDRDGGRSGSHRDDGEERAPSHSRSPSPAAAVDHMEGVRGRSLSRSPSIERIEG